MFRAPMLPEPTTHGHPSAASHTCAVSTPRTVTAQRSRAWKEIYIDRKGMARCPIFRVR
jgi:hypothetical protein